jgi:glycosyltransferase involved in cell wall biosynthesis
MTNAPYKQIIILGCFGGDRKKGGMETYVDSLSSFLKSQDIPFSMFPQSQEAHSSYVSLMKIGVNAMTKKLPASAIVIAQRPDDLFIFKKFKKNKSICVLHGDNLRKMELKKSTPIARLYRTMEKRGLKTADKIICVDQTTLDIYEKRYPWIKNKSIVIPVGVNTDIFKPLDKHECRKKLGIPDKGKVMLVAGRLEKEKNIEGAINLVKNNFDSDGYHLLIAGTGKEERKLKELAGQVKHAKIHFLDQVHYELMPEIINASDVVIVPSLFESGPLIILEAMACGVPSVSTDVGRASIFIGDSGCGAVVQKINNEFAVRVKEFLEPNPIINKKCMERVKLFSFHNTGIETLKIIEELR